jgi:MFS family permease
MGTLSPVRQAAHVDSVSQPPELPAQPAPPAEPPAQPALSTDAPAQLAPLAPAEVRRGLRISTVEAAVATVHISITGVIGGSVFLTGFALLLGADSFQLGILGALPFIGQLFQFVGAYLEERIGRRRDLVFFGALVSRLVWVLLLALPFMGFLGGGQLPLLFLGLAVSYAFNGIASNAWLSWMTDLVPARQRGSYFGVRNTIAAVAAMLTTFLAGRALDGARARGDETLGYALIFSVAVVAGVGAAALIARQPEPPLRPKARVNLRELFGAPLRDRSFRSFVLACAGWAVATGVAAPFFNAYGLNALGLSFSTLAMQGVVTGAVSLVFAPLAGRLQDRYGDRRVLLVCIVGTLLLPLGWIFSTPENIYPLWLTAIFSGVFWPGLNQGLANVLMERAPADCRGAAMASYSAVSGLGTLVAGLAGGLLATAIAGASLAVGPVEVAGLGFLFLLSALLRTVMAVVFWRTL